MEALDLDDVASLLDKSPRMVRNYIKDQGSPCSGDGRERRFIWREVLEWYVRYRIGLDGNDGNAPAVLEADSDKPYEEALRRRTIAEANLKELQLARERGQVVDVADVRRSVDPVVC